MRTEAAMLTAIALVTAGCVGTVSAGDPAMEPRTTAEDAASDWRANASLVSVFTAEDPEPNATDDTAEDAPLEARVDRSDGELADGEAPAWLYTYRAGGDELKLVVAANGSIVDRSVSEADPGQTPIEGWEVDSDTAAETIAEHNGTFADAGDARSAFYALYQNETAERPRWMFVVFHRDAAPAFYRVDATTGAYLGSTTLRLEGLSNLGDLSWSSHGDGETGSPPQEGGEISGTLNAGAPTDEEGFAVANDAHPELTVQLALDEPSAASTVEATVTAPDGTELTLTATGDAQTVDRSIDRPPEGSYDVRLELTQGARQGYTFTWCASGQDAASDEARTACQTVASNDDGQGTRALLGR